MGAVLRRLSVAGAAILIAFASTLPAAAQTNVRIITFAGATNLPVWVAVEKGYFAKEGLAVTQEITRGSTQGIQGLMDGTYQFASTALDNVIAIKEGQGDVRFENFDAVAILGIHSGLNKIVGRPEIARFEDVRGKAIAADALTSGYGLVLVKILAGHGLVAGKDYTALAVGSTPNRIAAMQEGKAVAAVIAPPEHIGLLRQGYRLLADAAEAIGAYQGSAFVVRQSWARAHADVLLAFIRAQVAATDYVFADKAGSLAIMRRHIQGVSDEDLDATYDEMVTSKGGLNRHARINDAGVAMLLALRNELSGAGVKLDDPSRYVDPTWYAKAVPN